MGGSYGGQLPPTCRTGEHYTGRRRGARFIDGSEGGSIGFRIGGQATDFVLLVMNPRGSSLHSQKQGEARSGCFRSPPAPGRTANALDGSTLRAEVLSYSRARGLFAGISLEGSTVRPDHDANERVYGRKLEAEDIIFKGAAAVPPASAKNDRHLNRKSPKNLSDPNSFRRIAEKKQSRTARAPATAGAFAQYFETNRVGPGLRSDKSIIYDL